MLSAQSNRPVDLLTDRTAGAFAGWLDKHPGVDVICRDRASAEGARTGAPDAIQVADRFHLLGQPRRGRRAHRDRAPGLLARDRPCLVIDVEWCPASGEPGAGEPYVVEQASTAPPEHGPQPRLVTRTRERHAAVAGLVAQGYSLNAIGRELGLGFRTVQHFARAATPDDLLVIALNRPSNLDRFKPYVHRRWNAGCTDAAVLHTELVELGWRGSLRTMQRYLRRFRDPDQQPQPAPAAPVKATPRRVTRWIMTDPEHLSAGTPCASRRYWRSETTEVGGSGGGLGDRHCRVGKVVTGSVRSGVPPAQRTKFRVARTGRRRRACPPATARPAC